MASTLESPLLEAWSGPFGGVPPWDLVNPSDFSAAFDAAIAEAEADIEAIAANPDAPTFANTIEALEGVGETLTRLSNLFYVHAWNLNVDPIPDIEQEVSPKLSAYQDAVIQNDRLFARIDQVFEHHAAAGPESLDPAARRLLDDVHRRFARNGALLDAEGRAELSNINQRLAVLYTTFGQNVLTDENEQVCWVTNEAELAGVPATMIESLAEAAAERGRSDAWAIANTRSVVDPLLQVADNAGLRQRVWEMFFQRGQAGATDNRPAIQEILSLRARKAQLLGYESYAHWQLEPAMAQTPEAAIDLMESVWAKATERVAEEVADMEALAGHPIERWDYLYYAEKVRKAHYDLDAAEIKPYLQLEKLIEAMLWCASELYGTQFRPLADGDVPVFHPDVRVWEMLSADGDHQALFYLDPYARPGKLSGAWMTDYRTQSRYGSAPATAIVSNNSNFSKPSGERPTLVSWDDARTLFHEFGHALHGMLSDVHYPSQSGTAVVRDWVEFPSQINEHWLGTDEVLNRFCVHYQTGEPMPAELVAKIRKSETFNQGFDSVEYLASALYDMKIHLAAGNDPDTAAAIDPLAFESEELGRLGLPRQVVMRHRPTHFAHVFSGDGYSAGYYSYLWADALTADAAEAFAEAGWFDPEVAASFHAEVLSAGDTIDPAQAFERFRGRGVDPAALMRKRGFATANSSEGTS